MPPRRVLVVLGLVLAAAACVPVPPPAAAPPAGGGGGGTPAPPSLPAAPGHGDALAAGVDMEGDPTIRNWQNPDAPDPFTFAVNPTWCDTGTGPPAPTACYYTYSTQVFPNITPVFQSTDLVTWEIAGLDGADVDTSPDGLARTSIAPWAELIGHWAPAVIERPANPPGSRFVMWYSAEKANVSGTREPHCLGVAIAGSPDGDFVDTSTTPAYCQEAQGGTIDASPFIDTDGTAYLTYKTDGTPSIPTRIYISQLAADGMSLVPGTERLLLETDNSSGSWEPPIIEGPTMVRSAGGLFLFYSAALWQDSSYKVGVARCDAPLGPCTRIYSTPVLASLNAMRGPGGQTPVFDTEDNIWRIVFHSWTDPPVGYSAGGKRSIHALPLYLSSPPSVG